MSIIAVYNIKGGGRENRHLGQPRLSFIAAGRQDPAL